MVISYSQLAMGFSHYSVHRSHMRIILKEQFMRLCECNKTCSAAAIACAPKGRCRIRDFFAPADCRQVITECALAIAARRLEREREFGRIHKFSKRSSRWMRRTND